MPRVEFGAVQELNNPQLLFILKELDGQQYTGDFCTLFLKVSLFWEKTIFLKVLEWNIIQNKARPKYFAIMLSEMATVG